MRYTLLLFALASVLLAGDFDDLFTTDITEEEDRGNIFTTDIIATDDADSVRINTDNDRYALEVLTGGGCFIPFMADAGAGALLNFGISIPMTQSNKYQLRLGFTGVSVDDVNHDYSSLNSVSLRVGSRSYPAYNRFSGHRGIEPFIGVMAGGAIAWDVVDRDSLDNTISGGASLALELGLRHKLSSDNYLDLVVVPSVEFYASELADYNSMYGIGLMLAYTHRSI